MAQPTTAGTEAPGGRGAFPPFQKETFASQIIWFAIAFVLLYLLMAKVGLPRVGAILAARRQRLADDLAAAEKLKAEGEAAVAAYEKALADARNNAQSIASQTRDKLMAAADARRKTLEGELNVKLAEAEKTIASTKTAAMSNVRGIATETASAIVQRLIGQAPNEKDVSAAVSDALKRTGSA